MQTYVDRVVRAAVPQSMRRLFDHNWRATSLFMQDGARCHTAACTLQAFAELVFYSFVLNLLIELILIQRISASAK